LNLCPAAHPSKCSWWKRSITNDTFQSPVSYNAIVTEIQRNWAGNYTYTAARTHRPKTIEQLREIVRGCKKTRALGTRHSFNAIADCDKDLISLEHFDRVVELDAAARQVTVEGGIRYGQLGAYLHQQRYALPNLASLPHISVAGACATGTHGSGDANGNLATAVSAMELITADGEVTQLSRDQHGEAFDGMVISLGGLGVITKLTLDIVPTFSVRQQIYENLPVSELENHFGEVMSRAYSVSLFTDWQSESVNQVWLKRLNTKNIASAPEQLFGAMLAPADRHPIGSISAENCTAQMDVPGPWHERLPHFRTDYTPSSGEELQSEYFVPREHAVAAFRAISRLRKQLQPLLQISEVRTVAADQLWMSPCYERASVAFHFTWKQNWPEVQKLLRVIEEQLAPFDARPHWGKLFTMSSARLQSLYAKLSEFRQLLQSHDPDGKFRNAFMDTYIF
jgi:xylitol oxidase